MEPVCFKELVENDASRRQPMVRIVLIVVVAITIRSYTLSPEFFILVLNITPAVLAALTSDARENFLKRDPSLAFDEVHNLFI